MRTRINTFLKSIKGKILLGVSSAVVLMAATILVLLGTRHYRTLRQVHENLVMENVDTAELSIEDQNKEIVSLARTMAETQESGLFGQRQESIEYTKSVLVENPQITAAFLAYEPNADQDDAAYLRQAGNATSGLDARGRFLPRWDQDFRDPNRIELQVLADVDTNLAYQGIKELFSSGTSQRYVITEPHVSRTSGKMVVDAVYPIVINGKFVGAAGVVRPLASFREHLRYLDTPYQTAEFFLISRQGRIVATTLNSQPELEHVEDGIYAKVLGRFAREKAAKQLRILTDPVTQEACYYAGEFIPTGGWMLVLQVSEREILAPIRQAISQAGGLSILGVLIALVWVVWMANSISRPISAAIAVAERVASGDLTARVELTSDGETGQLLTAITAMTQRLNMLVGQVQLSSVSLGSTTTQIASTAKRQATTAQEANAFTKEIMTSTQEICTTSHEFAQIAKDISEVAAENAALAGTGRNGLASMENTMRQLLETDSTISAKFTVLSEKASNINSVITTITKVADQTNILSLNAAIEAEKAGEYGRGFAVVAREIRRLADQTAVATLDIEHMVKEMQTAVSAGVTGLSVLTEEVRQGYTEVGRINAQLAQIIEHMQTLAPRLATLNQGVQSQSESAQRVSESMVQLGTVTQQIADALQETDQAVGLLNEETQALRQEIARFKVSLL